MEALGFGCMVLALIGALCLPLIRKRAGKEPADEDSDCKIVYGPHQGPFTETDRVNAAKALAEMENKRLAVHKALRKKGRIM